MGIPEEILPRVGACIGGEWREGDELPVVDPATGAELARLPSLGETATDEAIAAAEQAMAAAPGPEARSRWLRDLAAGLRARDEAFGRLITLENGKPLREGIAETHYAAGFFAFMAEQVQRATASEPLPPAKGRSWRIDYRPTGVAGLITPWNFPIAMLAKKLAAAIGAGCGVVAKPAELTPLTAVAFWHLAEAVGLPPGLLNLVIGDAPAIGGVLCRHPAVRLLHVTGSTGMGTTIAAQAAPHVKRLGLELGGNAPCLIFAGADLEVAADELIANKFRAGGQTCVCTNRVLLQASVVDDFLAVLRPKLAALTVGNGLEANSDIGPLIDRRGWEKVRDHVADALVHGAELLLGGEAEPPAGEQHGAWFLVTLLKGLSPQMRIWREETFGPVVAVASFRDEADGVRLANDTMAGLAAYCFSGEREQGERVLRQLRFGHLGLNTATGPVPHAPFGGLRHSGYGREGGFEGLREFLESVVVASG